MTDDWPKIGKIIISAVPALIISLGVLLVLIDTPWRYTAIQLGPWMVFGGAVLFVFELVVIYYLK
jgi:hypothetical protein